MGFLDRLLGKTGNINLSGLELAKIDELVKMLGDNKSNIDFSTDKLSGFQDLISKYLKSSLTEGSKQRILDRIILEFEINHYYSNNLASLSELAKKTGESPHHVSQVINEKLNKGFFELLAWYRIEEAKKIISDDHESKLTVEEISEMVGYNSKTAFNNAFKRLIGKTPSEFRKSIYS